MGGISLAGAEAGAGSYALSAWLFERLLGLIYGFAFASLAVQIRGLVGARGILPAAEILLEEKRLLGLRRFRVMPTLCWWRCTDGFLLFLCWGGAFFSALLVIGVAPMALLILLWVFYLSLLTVSGVWLGYQWDVLLLETGFVAIFLAPLRVLPSGPEVAGPSPVSIWLCWWLLFRLMFSSGMAKLLSRDPTWRGLTALTYQYETQPLPTPLSWYAHHLPARFHRISAALMFVIELAVPFFVFGSWPLRPIAGMVFIAFMILIMASGNYCFFNLLTIALCALLYDDRTWWRVLGWIHPGGGAGGTVRQASPNAARIAAASGLAATSPSDHLPSWAVGIAAVLLVLLSVRPMSRLLGFEIRWPRSLLTFFDTLEPLRLVNGYGLFAVMTTMRPAIIIEGSDDGTTWRSYEFKWKPSDLRRSPRFAIPHQPRLDWQMWFAALSDHRYQPWFAALLLRLMEGSPPVLALLRPSSSCDAPPVSPRFIRAEVYRYRFTTPAAHRATGAWWERERLGSYCPMVVKDRVPRR